MKAFFYYTIVTDLVRPNNRPLIKTPVKELFSDYRDFVFSGYIRFLGIKGEYPDAQFLDNGLNAVSVFVEGIEVFRKEIIWADTMPVEVEEDEMGDEK